MPKIFISLIGIKVQNKDNLDRPNPKKLIQYWNGTVDSLTHIRDGENFVYRFKSSIGRRLVLRVTDNSHRSHHTILAELEFINHLKKKGLSVAIPVVAKNGSLVLSENTNNKDFHACVFEEQTGDHFNYCPDDLNESLFTKWGSVMGMMHKISMNYRPSLMLKRHEWDQDKVHKCNFNSLPNSEIEVREEHNLVFKWLKSYPKSGHNYGLIHGDFERTNFMIHDDNLNLFDFDDCCYHWYMMDIASALWVFRDGPREERQQFLDWFLSGYKEHMSLIENYMIDFTNFIRMRNVCLFINYFSNGDTKPEWFQKMRKMMATPYTW